MKRAKLQIALGVGMVILPICWDFLLQSAKVYIERFYHENWGLGPIAQGVIVTGLLVLMRGVFLLGKQAREMTTIVEEATKPEKK